MKKDPNNDDMLPEYDFSGAVRGKYAAAYAAGTNVVLLDPDVAERFPDSKAVNDALRRIGSGQSDDEALRALRQALDVVPDHAAAAHALARAVRMLANRFPEDKTFVTLRKLLESKAAG